jgi:quercetin dioxygenase-like cupin family protein
VKDWNLREAEVELKKPSILSTNDDARAILIALAAGQEMGEHEVHERALIVVVEGEVEVAADGASVRAAAGHLLETDPGERHEVRALSDSRLLLLLVPWPGEGHPGALSLEQKASARERAAERGI